MKISKEDANDIVWERDVCDTLPVKYVKILDEFHGRWVSHHTLVLRDENGCFWGADFTLGLTEGQHKDPFEYETDPIEFFPMEEKVITTVVYTKKETNTKTKD